MTGRPETGLVTVVLVGSDGPDQLRLAPVHGGEERGEHCNIVVLDGLVDAAVINAVGGSEHSDGDGDRKQSEHEIMQSDMPATGRGSDEGC